MRNFSKMIQQAQQVQTSIQEMQARLGEQEVTGQAGGGLVQVVLSGKHEARAVKIDKGAVDPDDLGLLEDLLVAAFNDARNKVDDHIQQEMKRISNGLSLPPGMNLPF